METGGTVLVPVKRGDHVSSKPRSLLPGLEAALARRAKVPRSSKDVTEYDVARDKPAWRLRHQPITAEMEISAAGKWAHQAKDSPLLALDRPRARASSARRAWKLPTWALHQNLGLQSFETRAKNEMSGAPVALSFPRQCMTHLQCGDTNEQHYADIPCTIEQVLAH